MSKKRKVGDNGIREIVGLVLKQLEPDLTKTESKIEKLEKIIAIYEKSSDIELVCRYCYEKDVKVSCCDNCSHATCVTVCNGCENGTKCEDCDQVSCLSCNWLTFQTCQGCENTYCDYCVELFECRKCKQTVCWQRCYCEYHGKHTLCCGCY